MEFLTQVSQNTSADTPQWVMWGIAGFILLLSAAVLYDQKNK